MQDTMMTAGDAIYCFWPVAVFLIAFTFAEIFRIRGM